MIRHRSRHTTTAFFAAIALVPLVLAGCSSSTDDPQADPGDTSSTEKDSTTAPDEGTDDASDSDSTSQNNDTLTVWLMSGTLSDEAEDGIVSEFSEAHGIDVNIERQQWADIVTKLTTALATNNPPDVVQIGNTNVPLFAASGALADLTDYEDHFFGHDSWIAALDDPAHWEGSLYAVPYYASTRQVLYNQTVWSDAGIDHPPANYQELLSALDAIKAANPDPGFSALELQGHDWYNALSWVADAGGGLAHLEDGQWVADIDSPESLAGLTSYQKFQNTYSAAVTRSMRPGDQDSAVALANGQNSATQNKAAAINTVLSSNPELEGHIGSFALPSMSDPDDIAPVFAGGSNLAISVGSNNFDNALAFIEFLTSEDIQSKYVIEMSSNLPASVELAEKMVDTMPEFARPSFLALSRSVAVPPAPGWVAIEGDASAVSFFIQVAEGAGPIEDLARQFADHLEEVLNAD